MAATATDGTLIHPAPEALDAERRIVGDLAMGFVGVLVHVRPEWFHDERCKRIVVAARDLNQAGVPVEAVAIGNAYQSRHQDYPAVFLGECMERGTYGNAASYAVLIEKDWRRRETVKVGRELANGSSRDPAQVRTLTARLLELSTPRNDDGLDGVGMGAATLARSVIVRPPSLFGNGLMSPGDLGILYAKPRLGKTWLALLLGRAIARGEQWLGLPTTRGKVGMIGMETPDYVIQERYLAIASEGGLDDRDNDFVIIARNKVKDRLNLLNDDHWTKIQTLCVNRRLDLLILDALSRFHTVDEIAANEMGAVLGRVDDLRAKTGTAILLLHHEPKGVQGQEVSDDLDALRGSTRLASDPTFAARLVRFKNTPLVQLRFAKVSYGMEPGPIFLGQHWNGVPYARSTPEEVGDLNLEKVKHQLELAGESGLTSATLMERTRLRKSAVGKHLGALGAVRFHSQGEWRWSLPFDSALNLQPAETASETTDYGF